MLKLNLFKTFQIRNKIIKYYNNKVLNKNCHGNFKKFFDLLSRNLGLDNNFLSCLEINFQFLVLTLSCFKTKPRQDFFNFLMKH